MTVNTICAHRNLVFVKKSQSNRIAYFGPAGTFTEQALLTQKDLASSDLVAFRTVPDVLDAVAADEVDFGFVPIENSIEGTVNFTQDALVFDYDLLIQREIVLDIEHCLLARKGVSTGDLTGILSIPVATAQCHNYLRKISRTLMCERPIQPLKRLNLWRRTRPKNWRRLHPRMPQRFMV